LIRFVQATINGTMVGGFYAVVALGFALVWGVLGVINLAHGELIMLGAYITWILNKDHGWEPWAAATVVAPVMFAFGYVLQRLLVNRVIDRPHLTSLLVTYGAAIIIGNSVKLKYDATPRSVNASLHGFWRLGDDVTVPKVKFVVLLCALGLMLAVWAFLRWTRLGTSIRAASQNREAAKIVGIEIGRVYAFTFALAACLAGLAGLLASPTQPIYPLMGPTLTLKSFAIVAMAGLGRIDGVLYGGLLLGLIEVYAATYVPEVGANVGVISSFVVLVVILVLRPQGLFRGLKAAH
jgi:branched-chain amino acid transport system permease protein